LEAESRKAGSKNLVTHGATILVPAPDYSFKIDQSCADGVDGKQGDVGSTSEEDEMTFWLILITAVGTNGSATVTHIGNFSSLANCQNFARSATYPVTPPSLQDYAKIKMLCVQANDAQTKPPND
jgi:hypothetical protein